MCGAIWMRNEELTLASNALAVASRILLNCDTWRIIPSSYPPITLFEDCVDAEDLDALYALESLTNERIQDEVGELKRVPEEDRISGIGTSVIMASFTHTGMPSRFTTGDYGVYYAALSFEAAIAETRFWQEKQMADSNEPPFERMMRVYQARTNPAIEYADIREDKEAHNPQSYAYSQNLAAQYRNNGEFGLLYKSVRCEQAECIAAFKPKALEPARQAQHLRYCWDGEKIYQIEEVRGVIS